MSLQKAVLRDYSGLSPNVCDIYARPFSYGPQTGVCPRAALLLLMKATTYTPSTDPPTNQPAGSAVWILVLARTECCCRLSPLDAHILVPFAFIIRAFCEFLGERSQNVTRPGSARRFLILGFPAFDERKNTSGQRERLAPFRYVELHSWCRMHFARA